MDLAEHSGKRIEVLQNGKVSPLGPRDPVISSATCGWEGLQLEQHAGSRVEIPEHQHLTHVVNLHIGNPVGMSWRSTSGPGSVLRRAGNLVLLPRGTRDSVSWNGPLEHVILSIDPKVFESARQESLREPGELEERWSFEDPQIELLMRAMHAELRAGCPAGRLFGESLGQTLAVYLAQRYSGSPAQAPAFRDGLPAARLRRVLEYIRANLGEDISLSSLASTADLSPHHFSTLFRQSTGFSPHQYLLRQRISHARELLRDPEVSILEASARLGFVDQGHFTKVFRRITGVTPSQYRRQL
ncbi:MAG TPA: AraC family transcriptional regulator [Terriglobales bacterium]|nr:AraC family transcriptional regulator [Terriglobales bacterium]